MLCPVVVCCGVLWPFASNMLPSRVMELLALATTWSHWHSVPKKIFGWVLASTAGEFASKRGHCTWQKFCAEAVDASGVSSSKTLEPLRIGFPSGPRENHQVSLDDHNPSGFELYGKIDIWISYNIFGYNHICYNITISLYPHPQQNQFIKAS
jgi:hypothetical protein